MLIRRLILRFEVMGMSLDFAVERVYVWELGKYNYTQKIFLTSPPQPSPPAKSAGGEGVRPKK